MTTASHIPPTRDLEADDVRGALRHSSLSELLTDSFLRFRKADGFSFARSLAFQVVLATIPGLIMVVAIAALLGVGEFRSFIEETITTLAPGPASDLFLRAFEQGSSAGGNGEVWAVVVGGIAAISAMVTGMAQLQLGSNRIYGVEDDRSFVKRYLLATVLAITVGLALAAAFVLIVIGSSFQGELPDGIASAWSWARWPLGLALLVLGLAVLFKFAPHRPQPEVSWLTIGGGVAGVGWFVSSVALAMYLNASQTFGETYGPLAGFMGLMIWAEVTGVVILFGIAVAAQLEALRAGVTSPVEQAPLQRATELESTG